MLPSPIKGEQPPLIYIITILYFCRYVEQNNFRSITELREQYFLNQIAFERSNFTEPAKQGKDRLIAEKFAFISLQSLQYASENYLEIFKRTQLQYEQFDVEDKGYDLEASNFFEKYCWSPQLFPKDNCTIALVSTVGVEAKWKYPFTMEGNMMKAVGSFNFAHDLKLRIDILQLPFQGGKMLLTIVISRDQLFYVEAQRLFYLAVAGKFRVKIKTVYLPRLAFSIIIKDFAIDRYKVFNFKYNRYSIYRVFQRYADKVHSYL